MVKRGSGMLCASRYVGMFKCRVSKYITLWSVQRYVHVPKYVQSFQRYVHIPRSVQSVQRYILTPRKKIPKTTLFPRCVRFML